MGSSPKKSPEVQYDELKLSQVARDFLDRNHTELK